MNHMNLRMSINVRFWKKQIVLVVFCALIGRRTNAVIVYPIVYRFIQLNMP